MPSVVFQIYQYGPTPAERAAQLVGQLQDPSLADAKRADVGQQLAMFKEGGLQLVALASRGRLPQELKPVITAHIHRNPDVAVRAIAGKYFPRQTAAGAVLPPIDQLAKLPGDAARGRALFSGKASCNKCHRVAGQGASVGPNLTEIHRKFDRAKLLDAIVNPSAAILFGYESWLIDTVDGKVLTGTAVGSSAVQVYYGTANMQRRGYDIYAEIRRLGRERICEIHCKGNGALLGQGRVDVRRVKAAIDDIGWNGWLVIEGAVPKGQGVVEAYKKNEAILRSMF